MRKEEKEGRVEPLLLFLSLFVHPFSLLARYSIFNPRRVAATRSRQKKRMADGHDWALSRPHFQLASLALLVAVGFRGLAPQPVFRR